MTRSRLPGASSTSREPGALLDPCEVGPATHADHADLGGVALEQAFTAWVVEWVTRSMLSGADLLGEFGDGRDDARGDATRRPCAWWARPRWRRSTPEQLDGHRLGERAADVDADANTQVMSRAGAPWRRWRDLLSRLPMRGLTTNDVQRAENVDRRPASTWATSDGTVGQTPVASARKIGRRGPTGAPVRDHVGGLQRVAPRCRGRRPTSAITITTAMFMNVRTGSLRPSRNTANATAVKRDERQADAEQDVGRRGPRRTTAAIGRRAPSRSPRGTPR